MRFNLLSLHTEYFAFIDEQEVIASDGPCFYDIFESHCDSEEYSTKTVLKIYTEDPVKAKSHRNNYLSLEMKDVYSYINYLNKIMPFEYKIIEKRDKGHILLALETYELTHYEFKFLLTNLRYLWEFPQNVVLRESYELVNNGYFKDINILDVFNIVIRFIALPSYNDQIMPDLGLEVGNVFMSTDDISSKLKSSADEGVKLTLFYNSVNVPEEISDKFGCLEQFFKKELKDPFSSNFNKEAIHSRFTLYYKPLYDILNKSK